MYSFSSKDKQKWFIETTDHNEWNIEMDGDFYEKLIETTISILQNYDYVKNEIIKIQKINKEITVKNINYIREPLKSIFFNSHYQFLTNFENLLPAVNF